MRDEVKLCDGVVTLAPLHPAGPGAGPRPEAPLPHDLHERWHEELPRRWRAHGPARAFGIRAGRPVGTVALRPAPAGFAAGDVDLVYVLHPEARGRGLATRAVLPACAYAGAEGARRAVILTPAGRPAAAAVAHRAGFARRGQISHADGTLSDWHVRALVRT
ncbi:GNAT family N-acetyltransferase [Streptomyces sp. NPDC048717]|uniref:GNAT family N-acetyltransferase n=1 Tax=Streptomyces sp. NPDC048717 TaxID=3154928 RepID=UPI00342A8EB0